MRPCFEDSLRGKAQQAAHVALVVGVLAVVICVLFGVTACQGDDVSAPSASEAMTADADAGSKPLQTVVPALPSASAPGPVNFDAIHTARLAWPWRAAAEMVAWRMKGAH